MKIHLLHFTLPHILNAYHFCTCFVFCSQRELAGKLGFLPLVFTTCWICLWVPTSPLKNITDPLKCWLLLSAFYVLMLELQRRSNPLFFSPLSKSYPVFLNIVFQYFSLMGHTSWSESICDFFFFSVRKF